MRERTIHLQPIGTIRSPFTDPRGMPIQPAGAADVTGTVEVAARYADGLLHLEGFSHIVLIYHFHRSEGHDLQVTPYLDDRVHGVFATRAPRRPNPIGLSVVRLQRREGRILHVVGVDVLDGTPLLDIKPHVPDFEPGGPIRTGWLEDPHRDGRTATTHRADDRFASDAEAEREQGEGDAGNAGSAGSAGEGGEGGRAGNAGSAGSARGAPGD